MTGLSRSGTITTDVAVPPTRSLLIRSCLVPIDAEGRPVRVGTVLFIGVQARRLYCARRRKVTGGGQS